MLSPACPHGQLRVGTWNARSLLAVRRKSRRQKLRWLEAQLADLDVLLVQEVRGSVLLASLTFRDLETRFMVGLCRLPSPLQVLC